MVFKVAPIPVVSDDPFVNDCFFRKDEAENLTELIKNAGTGFVLALNAPWGMGKTTFVKMWDAYLTKQGIAAVYFSAWETDYAADPLIAFLAEMDRGLARVFKQSEEVKKSWEATKDIGMKVIKRVAPAVVKVATAGILDIDSFAESTIANAIGGAAEDGIKKYEEQRRSVKNFKINMSSTLKKAGFDRPVVIFVDELDRCRPTYAIEVLERLKHLFGDLNLVFVLSVDVVQLSHSVNAVYGQGFDSKAYLKRFFDLEYSLSIPTRDAYVSRLFEQLGFEEVFNRRRGYKELAYDAEHLKGTFLCITTALNFTLRDSEQLMGYVALVLKSTKSNEWLNSPLVVFLLVFKQAKPDEYDEFMGAKGESEVALIYFETISKSKFSESGFFWALIEASLILLLRESGELRRYTHQTVADDRDVPDRVSEYSRQVASLFGGGLRGVDARNLRIIKSKIDLARRFYFSDEQGSQAD